MSGELWILFLRIVKSNQRAMNGYDAEFFMRDKKEANVYRQAVMAMTSLRHDITSGFSLFQFFNR